MSHVVIVGAGLSGMAVAYRLQQAMPGVSLTLFDCRDRPGGNVWTEHRDGFRVETGPNGFLDNKPGAIQLCRDLGLGDRLLPASEGSRRNRFVFVGEKLHRLPSSPLGIFATPLLSVGGKAALLREPFRRGSSTSDESVAAFARRRFGKEAADIFIDALVTGIYAGDPERLSARSCFPRLVQFETESGSVLRGVLRSLKAKKRAGNAAPTRSWSFREGLRVLIDALTDRVSVTTGVRVKRIEATNPGWRVHGEGTDAWDADAVVLTCPAYEQANAVADLDPALADDLAAIPYNRVAVVALGYRQADAQAPDGFGYIAPQHTRRDVLGVQWCSSIYPDRAPPGFVLWRALCGGTGRPDVFDLDDETLVRACHREMRLALGVKGEPMFRQVVRWPRAIPQYHLGHQERVDRIETAVGKHAGLFVTGNALRGVALPDVAEQAEATATRAAAYLREVMERGGRGSANAD